MERFIKNLDKEKLQKAFNIKTAFEHKKIDLASANRMMREQVKKISPIELAYIEQNFQAPVDDECIKEDLERMLAIYDGVLTQSIFNLKDGHPINNYLKENKAIRNVLKEIDGLLNKQYIKNVWDEAFESLKQFKFHLVRKQNQLYSALEQKGFNRPTTTMWLFDDVVKKEINQLIDMAQDISDINQFKTKFVSFKLLIEDLMNKEETILYPASLELLNEEEFYEMVSGDHEIGYCLIEVDDNFVKTKINRDNDDNFQQELQSLLQKYRHNSWNEDTVMDVKQGRLSLKQINLIFQNLPVDFSYVDENDLVAFYSDTKHRIFPRSKGVIGRNVKNCHPQHSVAIVEEIIEKFREGSQDKVEFWINKPNAFIYIVYTAIRDEQGEFRGVLEMMQDCTHIRSLEGSRTLLTWENENQNDDTKIFIEETNHPINIVDSETKLSDLLATYPDIKEKLISINPKFKMLNTPLAKVMIPLATIRTMAERINISIDVLIKELNQFIGEKQ